MGEKPLLNHKRLLIVDDEQDILDTLEELLPMCWVIKASTFDEAKELLETQYFDMAILDIMGVNGYALLEIAKQYKVIPVMLTAHALSPESLVKSYNEGAAFYVPKDEIENIATFLNDVLESIEQGKSTWSRWLVRVGGKLAKRFGADGNKKNP